MSVWEPASEAEAAMREALSTNDQELYFRILARTELLLPVSADAIAGRAEMGWGTWTSGNRTHVLSFTSSGALYACLAQHAGSYRQVPFQKLASEWPNHEWWLAVNPGLPIEAYLPSWFVSQLTRGDVRLPGRTMGARARMAHSEIAANGRRGVATAGGLPKEPGYDGPFGSPPPGMMPPAGPITPIPTPPVAPVSRTMAEPGRAPVDPRARLADPVEAEIIDPSPTVRVPSPTSQYATEATVVSSARAPQQAYSSPGYRPAEADRQDAADRQSADRSGADRRTGPAPQQSARPESGAQQSARPESGAQLSAADAWAAGFSPANTTEANLLTAAQKNNTDEFLSTLLLARVIVPVAPGTPPSARPTSRDFPWQLEEIDGQPYVSVFTSPERLAEHMHAFMGAEIGSVSLRFLQLIGAWPDPEISFAVNPGSPVGATLPGSQIVALAAWAAEVGLSAEPAGEVMVARPAKKDTPSSTSIAGPAAGNRITVMQKMVTPSQLPYYLERGYDRVSGFVHRATEVSHLTTPRKLFHALGLSYAGSPFRDDDPEAYVVRWIGHRVDLYRIPFGGQHEQAMHAMQGWVIERPPFRGNGFAPGDTGEVIAEFKVDSVRLPHGAQMIRYDGSGVEQIVATFDADSSRWIRTAPPEPVWETHPAGYRRGGGPGA